MDRPLDGNVGFPFQLLFMSTSPVGITLAAIFVTGLIWLMSEPRSGMRKMAAVAFGGAIALGASTVLTVFFGA